MVLILQSIQVRKKWDGKSMTEILITKAFANIYLLSFHPRVSAYRQTLERVVILHSRLSCTCRAQKNLMVAFLGEYGFDTTDESVMVDIKFDGGWTPFLERSDPNE